MRLIKWTNVTKNALPSVNNEDLIGKKTLCIESYLVKRREEVCSSPKFHSEGISEGTWCLCLQQLTQN